MDRAARSPFRSKKGARRGPRARQCASAALAHWPQLDSNRMGAHTAMCAGGVLVLLSMSLLLSLLTSATEGVEMFMRLGGCVSFWFPIRIKCCGVRGHVTVDQSCEILAILLFLDHGINFRELTYGRIEMMTSLYPAWAHTYQTMCIQQGTLPTGSFQVTQTQQKFSEIAHLPNCYQNDWKLTAQTWPAREFLQSPLTILSEFCVDQSSVILAIGIF